MLERYFTNHVLLLTIFGILVVIVALVEQRIVSYLVMYYYGKVYRISDEQPDFDVVKPDLDKIGFLSTYHPLQHPDYQSTLVHI